MFVYLVKFVNRDREAHTIAALDPSRNSGAADAKEHLGPALSQGGSVRFAARVAGVAGTKRRSLESRPPRGPTEAWVRQ